jgi:hypothetical protein
MIVEVRSYRLFPGTHATFGRLFHAEALPMLRSRGIDVVAFGASPDNPDAAFLIRAFDDLDDRQRREDAFYSSAEWRTGPREPILACIETYTDAVLDLDRATVDGLRRLGLGPAA